MFVASSLVLLLASQTLAFSPSWLSVRHPAALQTRIPLVLYSEEEPVAEAVAEVPEIADLPLGEPAANVEARTLADLEIGSEMDGVVKGVSDFGAFVDFGCEVDGLVHKSQMSTEFVTDPTEVVSVGDTVHVRVIRVDTSKKQVSLSMKPEGSPNRAPRSDRPPRKAADLSKFASMQPADRITGSVVTITPFGAFVELGGAQGLIHISQLADTRVESVESVVSVGDEVSVRVLSVEDGRISLSLKEYDENAPVEDKPRRKRGNEDGGRGRRNDFVEDIWNDNTESQWADIMEKEASTIVFDNKPAFVEA